MLMWQRGQVLWTVVVVEIYWVRLLIRLVGLVTWPSDGVSLRLWAVAAIDNGGDGDVARWTGDVARWTGNVAIWMGDVNDGGG